MKDLYLMVGIPGAGKSTYIMDNIGNNEVWISRDKIRFSIVDEDEEYFSHEVEVFETFVREINEALADPNILGVFVDATHINKASRRKILERLDLTNVEVTAVWIQVALETALEQNENRKDTRAYVPRGAIRRMFHSIEAPSTKEKFINEVWIKKEKK